MKVKDLIEKLQKLPPDLPVYLRYWQDAGPDGSGWDEIRDAYSVDHTSDRDPWPHRDLPERVEIT